MTDQPITPTRIIPGGTPLPPRPPAPGETPPWWGPAPPAATVEPPPGPIEIRIVHEPAPVPPEPPQPGLFHRVWDWLSDQRLISALAVALTPWMGGTSPVSAWSGTLHQARTEAGISGAYVIAGVAVGAAWVLDRRTGRWLPRVLLTTALIGGTGAIGWYDPVTFVTGVHL